LSTRQALTKGRHMASEVDYELTLDGKVAVLTRGASKSVRQSGTGTLSRVRPWWRSTWLWMPRSAR
jgi:hypothetical protein